MGVGDPQSLLDAISAGVDMFDCVLPTRLARHGTVLTSQGRMNLRKASYADDDRPLDPGFPQSPANRWSRAYLRHLLSVREPAVARILTLHNLAWLNELMRNARNSIEQGNLRHSEPRRQLSGMTSPSKNLILWLTSGSLETSRFLR